MELFGIIILYSSIVFCIILGIIKRESLISPQILFSIVMFLACFQVIPHYLQELNFDITYIYLIFLYSLFFGFYFARKKKIKKKPPPKYRYKTLLTLSVAILFLAILFLVVSIQFGGGLDVIINSTRQDKMLIGRAYAFLGIYNDFLVVSAVLFFTLYNLKKSKFILVTVFFIVLLKITLGLIFSSRNFMIEIILVVLVYYEFMRNKQIKASYSIIVIIVIITGAQHFKGYTRAIILNASYVPNEWVTSSFQPGVLQVQYNVIKTIVKNYDDIEMSKKYGLSYIQGIFLRTNPFIKGESLSTWFSKKWYSDKFNKGGGQGFSQIAESYLAFGIFGVFLWGLFIGYVSNYYYRLSRMSQNRILYVAIYAIFIMAVFRVLRSEFTSILNGYILYRIVPLLLVFYFSRKLNLYPVK